MEKKIFSNRILKAALLFMLSINTVFGQNLFSFNTSKKRSLKRVYRCDKVGTQKIKSKKFNVLKKEPREKQRSYASLELTSQLPKTENTEFGFRTIENNNIIENPSGKEKEGVELELPMPQPVYFKFDSDELAQEDISQISLAVEYVKSGKTVIIEGHTDSHGSFDYNQRLSLKRVNKIREIMLSMAEVDEKYIHVRPQGEHQPASHNSTEDSRQLNRRVEFIIIE